MFGIGTQELIVGAVLIGAIALFGKGLIVKTYKDWFTLKKELKTIKDGEEVKVPTNV